MKQGHEKTTDASCTVHIGPLCVIRKIWPVPKSNLRDPSSHCNDIYMFPFTSLIELWRGPADPGFDSLGGPFDQGHYPRTSRCNVRCKSCDWARFFKIILPNIFLSRCLHVEKCLWKMYKGIFLGFDSRGTREWLTF